MQMCMIQICNVHLLLYMLNVHTVSKVLVHVLYNSKSNVHSLTTCPTSSQKLAIYKYERLTVASQKSSLSARTYYHCYRLLLTGIVKSATDFPSTVRHVTKKYYQLHHGVNFLINIQIDRSGQSKYYINIKYQKFNYRYWYVL